MCYLTCPSRLFVPPLIDIIVNDGILAKLYNIIYTLWLHHRKSRVSHNAFFGVPRHNQSINCLKHFDWVLLGISDQNGIMGRLDIKWYAPNFTVLQFNTEWRMVTLSVKLRLWRIMEPQNWHLGQALHKVTCSLHCMHVCLFVIEAFQGKPFRKHCFAFSYWLRIWEACKRSSQKSFP